jgi:hypothetical protein
MLLALLYYCYLDNGKYPGDIAVEDDPTVRLLDSAGFTSIDAREGTTVRAVNHLD